ncbi:MAG: LamG domain-containing protein [Candidatus Bathyarchaeota archaeon]|nr:LamG domain-containing protein [Candidatus Bathyarchaeota archaeon]
MNRKAVSGIVLGLLLTGILPIWTQSVATPPLGMVSYWRLNEGSGTTAYDSVSDNDGTLVNGPEWTTGIVDGGLSFDGIDDYVGISHHPDLNIGGNGKGFTAEAWIKTPTPMGSQQIIRKGFGAVQYEFKTWGYGRLLRLIVYPYGTSYHVLVDAAIIADDGNWHHVAATKSASDNLLRIYFDGELVGTSTSPCPGTEASTAPLLIGTELYPGYWFKGTIDEVAIHNRTLALEEIQQHYENGLIGLDYFGEPCMPATEWDRTYIGGSDEGVHKYAHVVQTCDGGYAILGFTDIVGAGKNDFWLVKTNSTGHVEWNQTYGGADDDWAYCLIQTVDGGYAIAGETQSYGSGGSDFWLVKTNSTGHVEWNQTYGTGSEDAAYSVVQARDGGYVLVGRTQLPNYDFFIVKTNSTGHMEWSRTYGEGMYPDNAESIIQTSDGGYTIAGETQSYGSGGWDFWLVKTNSTGYMEWNRTYGGASHEMARSLVQTDDGGYALTGHTESFGEGDGDFWLVKTDSTGHVEWNQTYGATGHDAAYSIVQTADGGYTIAGFTNSYGAGHYDFWVVKTNSTGHVEWNQTYGTTGHDAAYSIVQTADGGYGVAGRTVSPLCLYDLWLIKLSPPQAPELYIRRRGAHGASGVWPEWQVGLSEWTQTLYCRILNYGTVGAWVEVQIVVRSEMGGITEYWTEQVWIDRATWVDDDIVPAEVTVSVSFTPEIVGKYWVYGILYFKISCMTEKIPYYLVEDDLGGEGLSRDINVGFKVQEHL